MEEGQLELFEEEVNNKTVGLCPVSTCSKCNNITGVGFGHKTLFFCAVQKGGRYGKKIKKSAPSCSKFSQSEETLLKLEDGYFGGSFGTTKR